MGFCGHLEKRAGEEGIPSRLREYSGHTCASLLVSLNVNMKVIQKYLGTAI